MNAPPLHWTGQPAYGHRPGGGDCTADRLLFSHGQGDALYLAGQVQAFVIPVAAEVTGQIKGICS